MRNLKVALSAVCAVVVGWAFTASADIPASAYVQDGLIVQFDGIENAGTGTYDATATTWTDLTGNGRNGTLSGKTAWNGKGLSITSVSSSDKGLVTFDATHNASFTFDICLKVDKANGQYARITAENATPAMCCYGKGSSLTAAHPYVYGPGDDKDIGTVEYDATVLHTSTLLQSGDKADGWVWYHDGAPLAHSTCGGTSMGSRSATLGNRSSDYARGLNGTYYAVRIYNRALTADEVAYNANIDKIRFEGANPATLTWPDGYRWNDAEGRIEYAVRVLNSTSDGGIVTVDDTDIGVRHEAWYAFGTACTSTIKAMPKEGYRFARWDCDDGMLTTAERLLPVLTLNASRALSLTAVFYAEGETSVRYYPLEYVEGKGAQWVNTEQTLKCGQTFRILWSQNPEITYVNAGCNGAWGTDTYVHGWQGAGYKQANGYPITAYHNGYNGFSPEFNSGNFVLGDLYGSSDKSEKACSLAA